MRPPLRLGEFAMPKYEIITLPETHWSAPRRATPVPGADLRVPPSDARSVLARIFKPCSGAPADSVWPERNASQPGKDDEQEVFYTTALTPDMANGYIHGSKPVVLEGGEYVMFSYEGLGTGVQEFILTVYGTCMPMLNLNRRKGQDIERYYPAQDAKPEEGPINLRMEFLIPVRR